MPRQALSLGEYAGEVPAPVNLVDPEGKDIILVIWTTGTEDNGVGHAGVAISNYKKEKYVEYDAKGVAIEKFRIVPDGTYTFYDNWPKGRVNFDLKGAITSVEAHRNVIVINSVEEFTNGSTVSPSESNTPNAILKLSTSYKQDMAVSERLLKANVKNKEYNGAWYNCSSYVSDGLKAIFGKTISKEGILGPMRSVTPNQLWKDALKYSDKSGRPYYILKDPGSSVDKKFKTFINEGKQL